MIQVICPKPRTITDFLDALTNEELGKVLDGLGVMLGKHALVGAVQLTFQNLYEQALQEYEDRLGKA